MPRDAAFRARAATTAAFLAAGVCVGVWAAVIPSLKAGLALSDSTLGLVLLAGAAGSLSSMTLAGRLADRLGSRRVTMAFGCMTACVLPLPAQMPSAFLLGLSAYAFGASVGGLDISMNAHAAMVQRRRGRTIMSSFHGAFSLGGLVGSSVAGALLTLRVSVSVCMGTAAVLVLGLASAMLASPASDASPVKGELAPRASGRRFGALDPFILTVGAVIFACALIEGGMADWSGVYLSTIVGASTGVAAVGYSAFSIAMAIGRLFGDGGVRALGPMLVMRGGCVLAAVGMAVALAFPSIATGIAGFALVGLGASNVIPVLFTAVSQRRSDSPGAAVALAATIGYGGFLLGPPIIGGIADLVGLRAALLLLLGSALFAAVLASVETDAATSGRKAEI